MSMMSEDSHEYAEMREQITQLEAKVKYQDEVIEQMNAMCSRLEKELAIATKHAETWKSHYIESQSALRKAKD